MELLNVTHEITIARSPEAVWALLTDLESHPRLGGSDEVQTVRRLDDGPVRPGLEFEATEVVHLGPKVFDLVVRSRVVTVEANRLLVWHTVSPAEFGKPTVKLIEWTFRLREAPGGGTTLTHSLRMVNTSAWVTPLFKPFFLLVRGNKVNRGMAQTLHRIAAELNADAPTSAG